MSELNTCQDASGEVIFRCRVRAEYVLRLLKIVYPEIVQKNQSSFTWEGIAYSEDSVLCLVFELYQYASIFEDFGILQKDLHDYLKAKHERLNMLLWTGHLDHLSHLIGFKNDFE